jgi:hypothetical protein
MPTSSLHGCGNTGASGAACDTPPRRYAIDNVDWKDPLSYVRNMYSVPAYPGAKITFNGEPAEVIGAEGAHIWIVRGEEREPLLVHPTWHIDWFPDMSVEEARATSSESGHGSATDGSPFWPGTPCLYCGKFVGRDGHFSVDHFEMSSEIASVEAWHRGCG